MRHPATDDKIIVRRDGDGHWTYFSVRDDTDNGTVIDFVQRRRAVGLGGVRKELRAWLREDRPRMPVQLFRPNVRTQAGDEEAVRAAFERARAGRSHYLAERCIAPGVERDEIFRYGRVDEVQLSATIRRYEGMDGRPSEAVASSLVEASILWPVPEADGVLELAKPFSTLMAWLLKPQRLTSAAIIHGYLQELDDLWHEVHAAMNSRSPEAALRCLHDIGEVINRVWQDSKNNRDGLTTEATHAGVTARPALARPLSASELRRSLGPSCSS